jgi:hypothetical protein
MIKLKEICATIEKNLALIMFVELWAYDYLTFRGGEKNTKEMQYLVSLIHNALKLLISSLSILLESNQWAVMGSHE